MSEIHFNKFFFTTLPVVIQLHAIGETCAFCVSCTFKMFYPFFAHFFRSLLKGILYGSLPFLFIFYVSFAKSAKGWSHFNHVATKVPVCLELNIIKNLFLPF